MGEEGHRKKVVKVGGRGGRRRLKGGGEVFGESFRKNEKRWVGKYQGNAGWEIYREYNGIKNGQKHSIKGKRRR
jgi:hypothetical protein